MNLQVEYYRRHKQDVVLPANGGLCFFNELKKPSMICLVGGSPKISQTCPLCNKSDTITLEIFAPDREIGIVSVSHKHVHPDTDLAKLGLGQPVYLKDGADVEVWVWNFFLQNSRLKKSKNWVTWSRSLGEMNSHMRTAEELVHCAMEHPRSYNLYYEIYQSVTAGRKYLTFE